MIIAVKEKFTSKLITIPGTHRSETVVVEIALHCNFLYICCIYIPSGSAVITYKTDKENFNSGLLFDHQ